MAPGAPPYRWLHPAATLQQVQYPAHGCTPLHYVQVAAATLQVHPAPATLVHLQLRCSGALHPENKVIWIRCVIDNLINSSSHIITKSSNDTIDTSIVDPNNSNINIIDNVDNNGINVDNNIDPNVSNINRFSINNIDSSVDTITTNNVSNATSINPNISVNGSDTTNPNFSVSDSITNPSVSVTTITSTS